MRTRIWHSDWKPRWLIRCVSAALLSFMDKQEGISLSFQSACPQTQRVVADLSLNRRAGRSQGTRSRLEFHRNSLSAGSGISLSFQSACPASGAHSRLTHRRTATRRRLADSAPLPIAVPGASGACRNARSGTGGNGRGPVADDRPPYRMRAGRSQGTRSRLPWVEFHRNSLSAFKENTTCGETLSVPGQFSSSLSDRRQSDVRKLQQPAKSRSRIRSRSRPNVTARATGPARRDAVVGLHARKRARP